MPEGPTDPLDLPPLPAPPEGLRPLAPPGDGLAPPPPPLRPFPFLEIRPTPPLAAPPRVWSCFVAIAAAFGIALCLTILVGAVLGLRPDGTADLLEDPAAFFAMLVGSQTAVLIAAVAAAALSPEPIHERLGFVRGRVSTARWPLLALGAIPALVAGGLVRSWLFPIPEGSLTVLDSVMRDMSPGWTGTFVVTMSLLPGLCEETLFRGYVQRRFGQRWRPWIAVPLASLLFVGFHLDMQQGVAILPLAFWLGYVAWRSGSTFPGMGAHAVANAFGVGVPLLVAPALSGEDPDPALGGLLTLLLVGSLAALVVSVVSLESAAARERRSVPLPL